MSRLSDGWFVALFVAMSGVPLVAGVVAWLLTTNRLWLIVALIVSALVTLVTTFAGRRTEEPDGPG